MSDTTNANPNSSQHPPPLTWSCNSPATHEHTTLQKYNGQSPAGGTTIKADTHEHDTHGTATTAVHLGQEKERTCFAVLRGSKLATRAHWFFPYFIMAALRISSSLFFLLEATAERAAMVKRHKRQHHMAVRRCGISERGVPRRLQRRHFAGGPTRVYKYTTKMACAHTIFLLSLRLAWLRERGARQAVPFA